MKRRLRIAGTALGAFLVPACAGVQSDPMAMRPSVTPPRPPGTPAAFGGSTSTVAAKMPRVVDKFAEGRHEPTATIVQQPLPVGDVPIATAAPTKTDVLPVEPRVADPVPPLTALPRPAAATAAEKDKTRPEPVPDAEGIIRANWPVIKGPVSVAEPGSAPVLPPPSELNSPAKPTESPIAIPPALPPGVIGTSQHQTHASPVDSTPAPVAAGGSDLTLPSMSAQGPLSRASDTPLLRAVQAFEQNRPDEAVECLKACDPVAQQALLSLMPAIVRLSDDKFKQIKPDEMDVLLEQLIRVPSLLRSRASLQANNVRLCREVHNFGHVEPFPSGHQFHPGDIVYLYLELANFTCKPDSKGGFTIAMASGIELRDTAGNVVWRADPKEIPDTVSSPPQDYYRNFRLCVPGLSPGAYTLSVKTIDRPTGREVTKAVELRIGAR